MMSKLLANRKTSNLEEDEEDKGRKKRRPLGRAQSGRSNTSTAEDLLSKPNSTEENDTIDTTAAIEEKHRKVPPDTFNPTQASQELGWDSPGAQRARENMIRSMGGKVKDKKKTVETAKVVVDQSVGKGGRASRRKKG
jgi:DNA replication regulator DPB11